MSDSVITIFGEHPDEADNPSKCFNFKFHYPKLFSPLQVETFTRIKEGRSLALVAPTSSGKTLAVAAPIFEFGLKAVFIYPFRALVLDQTNQLIRYADTFGITSEKFTQIIGGTPQKELAHAIEKDYILMTPDKLVSLFQDNRIVKGAALTILTNYVFVFDEIHAYNSLMRMSLKYFIRSVKYWREGTISKLPAFYFLSATFPDDLWPILKQELGMTEDDKIEGVSNTGTVSLILHPEKDDPSVIAQDIKDLRMTDSMVAVFNTALKAWEVAKNLWGNNLAQQHLFVGQDKMSEDQRLKNFQLFINNPTDSGLCGSSAIEAGVDFTSINFVIEENYADSFLQRFGRSARSGKNASVLCYSSTLYNLLIKGKLKSQYTRKEFLDLIRQELPLREPKNLLAGLAAYPYYLFWDGPNFIDSNILNLCQKLKDINVDNFLAFRGFIPYTHYQTGESINYRTLFKKTLPIQNNLVVGTPGLERYFFATKRKPVLAILKKSGLIEQVDKNIIVMLVKVDFQDFGEAQWVVLEYKNAEYTNYHPNEPDDNICLRINGMEMGRISEDKRNGILRFYEIDS